MIEIGIDGLGLGVLSFFPRLHHWGGIILTIVRGCHLGDPCMNRDNDLHRHVCCVAIGHLTFKVHDIHGLERVRMRMYGVDLVLTTP